MLFREGRPLATASHREYREQFYAILDDLSARLGGGRAFRHCDGRMSWPSRGVYFFFEPGEVRAAGAAGQRVVRVGTHAVSAGSKTTLWQRLKQHRGYGGGGSGSAGSHRGSVFRHHVGLALMRSGRGPNVAEAWMTASPTPEMRASELPLEQLVSEYLASMRVLWVEADDMPGPNSIRAYIEAHAIALLSEAATAEPASPGWLGQHAADEAVRRSGLWNVKHVGRSFDRAFLDVFQRLAAHTPSVSLGAQPRGSPVKPPAVMTPIPSSRLDERTLATLQQPVLALISCTKKKAPCPCRAAELYAPSSFFRLAYAFARRVARDTFVLSAKHGLVHPDDAIAPYEQTLANAGGAERRAWALGVHRQLVARTEYREAKTILWFAGEAYRGDLMTLVLGDGKRCVVPMQGLAQGEQLAWLTRNAHVRAEAFSVPPPVAAPAARRVRVEGNLELPTGMSARRTASVAPTAAAFEQELGGRLARARRDSKRSLTVNAGELHRAVGGYPGRANRMPICCRVMRKYMSAGDRVVAAPPKGDGASLTVCYELE